MTVLTAPLSSSAFFTPALNGLKKNTNDLAQSTARLSSGSRIVNISDDVAALSIATQLQSQLSGLKQASQNVAQGSSLLQVASGGLTQVSDLLDSLDTLASQATSTALTDTERGFLQEEFSQLLDEIDRIAGSTSFNNINLLDGTFSAEEFQVGVGADETITVTIDDVGSDSLFVGTPDITSAANAADAQDDIEAAREELLTIISNVGALQERFNAASDNIASTSAGITEANSNLVDTDIVEESSRFAQATLRVNSGIAVIAQAQRLQSSLLAALQFSKS